MVSFRAGATAAFTVFSLLGSSLAFPLFDKLVTFSPGARDLLKRSNPAPPRFVVYNDAWVSPIPKPNELKGYNVYALSFLLSSGAADMALQWQQLSDSERASYLKEFRDAGMSIVVSAFGSTEEPTTAGENAVTVANNLASWVKKYGVHGIDIDYEDLNAFDNGSGSAEQWLISLTRQLRKHLPEGQYLISHAPVAPWFSPGVWHGGGYLEVNKQVGNLIDFYNIQFYNQGTQEYTTCEGLLEKSSSTWPKTSVFEIAASGVDRNKIVIGKPAKSSDASNGYVSPRTLAKCVAQAHGKGWDAGVMVWEFPDAPSSWVNTVRGKTF